MKWELIIILSVFTLFSCDTGSVELEDENYEFDGRGGIKCDVDGTELKPRLVLSPGARSAELTFFSDVGEDFMILRFDTRDKNGASLDVQMTVKGFNPAETNLEGLTFDLDDDDVGIYKFDYQVEYSTDLEYTGEIEIVYHDPEKGILAGKFWYDAINSDNEIKEIRNGEFDMSYF